MQESYLKKSNHARKVDLWATTTDELHWWKPAQWSELSRQLSWRGERTSKPNDHTRWERKSEPGVAPPNLTSKKMNPFSGAQNWQGPARAGTEFQWQVLAGRQDSAARNLFAVLALRAGKSTARTNLARADERPGVLLASGEEYTAGQGRTDDRERREQAEDRIWSAANKTLTQSESCKAEQPKPSTKREPWWTGERGQKPKAKICACQTTHEENRSGKTHAEQKTWGFGAETKVDDKNEAWLLLPWREMRPGKISATKNEWHYTQICRTRESAQGFERTKNPWRKSLDLLLEPVVLWGNWTCGQISIAMEAGKQKSWAGPSHPVQKSSLVLTAKKREPARARANRSQKTWRGSSARTGKTSNGTVKPGREIWGPEARLAREQNRTREQEPEAASQKNKIEERADGNLNTNSRSGSKAQPRDKEKISHWN
jgi:hypothetical protein